MRREDFFSELAALDSRFNQLAPELELTVRDPALGVEGYVVVWTTLAAVGGPLGRCGKGGTRITPAVSLEEIKMLARTMALKNAAAGLPLGGAKSGLKADPDSADFEKKYRRFVSMVKPVLRENGGIFGGFGYDIGGKPVHARWACEELGSTKAFTGKPVEMGGTDYDREGIAGLGVVSAGVTTLELMGERPESCSCAIQGLGAMGSAVYRYVRERGVRVQCVSDPRLGGAYRLTPEMGAALADSVRSQDFAISKRVLEEQHAERLALERVLYEPADVLFPCAVQGVISVMNQAQVRARYVVEGANNPCSEEARTLLWNRQVTVIPDFIANPGGIIAAFVEMTSEVAPEENARTRRNVEEAKRLTEEKIRANLLQVLDVSCSLRVEPAQAGRYLALKSIFRA